MKTQDVVLVQPVWCFIHRGMLVLHITALTTHLQKFAVNIRTIDTIAIVDQRTCALGIGEISPSRLGMLPAALCLVRHVAS